MGLAEAYGPFLPAAYHLFVLREAGRAPPERAARAWPITRSRRSLGELSSVTADPSKTGNRTPNPAGSRLPVETPSQWDPTGNTAAQEERGVLLYLRVLFLIW